MINRLKKKLGFVDRKKLEENNEQGKTKKNIEVAEKNIYEVMEKTGWDFEYATEKIEEARKRLGISYTDYNKYAFYNIPLEKQVEEYKLLPEKKAKVREQRKRHIESVMEKTGWDFEYTNTKMKNARERLGISYKAYDLHNFHEIPLEKQEGVYKEILEKKAQKKKEKTKKSELELTIEKVMEKTGWSYDKAKKELLESRKHTGCSYKEYLLYRMYDLNKEEQGELFLISMSRKIREKYDVSKETAMILNHKELTNINYSDYLKRPWCVNTKISFEEFEEKFSNCNRIIYKPLRGCRGFGVTSFNIDENNLKEVYDKLCTFPDGLIERYVVQHSALSSLSPSSVNTIRIATISSNTQTVTKDGKYKDIAYAALRIGGGTSIVDNFHSGGMVAAIDLEKGELITDAADMEGNVFRKHPITGTIIKGFKIPFFKEAVEMVMDAIEKKKPEGYLGWDIAITENGPVLIEINLSPGVVLLSMPYVSEKKGMKHVMEKYL